MAEADVTAGTEQHHTEAVGGVAAEEGTAIVQPAADDVAQSPAVADASVFDEEMAAIFRKLEGAGDVAASLKHRLQCIEASLEGPEAPLAEKEVDAFFFAALIGPPDIADAGAPRKY